MGWTVTLNTSGYPRTYDLADGTTAAVYKVHCISDAGASGTQTMSTLINTAFSADPGAKALWNQMLSASVFYCLKTSVTGNVTDSTVVVSDENSAQILSKTTGTSGAKVYWGGADTSFEVPVSDLIFTATSLGAANVGDLYFWMLKLMPGGST
jgi:hypothetical protein